MSSRRGDSNDEAGTHDEAMKKTSSGRPSVASISQWTPSVPSTFAISCGSATTAVVPSGSTSRANSSGSSFDDSRCMWASMKPGTTQRPGRVERPRALVVAEPGDEAVDDRHVGVEPLAREHAEHAARRGRRGLRARRRARPRGAAKGMQPLRRNRTVRPMDVLAPRTLDEALRLKAEHPDAPSDPGRHRPDGRAELRPRAAARRSST